MNRVVRVAFNLMVLMAAAFASADTIDFHFLPGSVPTTPGQSISNEYAAQGVLFGTDSGAGLLNASITGYDCCGTETFGALVNATAGGTPFTDRQTNLDIFFTSLATGVSFTFDNYSGGASVPGAYVNVYGDGGVLLASYALPDGSSGGMDLVMIPDSGISQLQIVNPSGARGWLIAIGELDYSPYAPETPEPATLALMGSGLIGAVGAIRRRLLA